MGRHLKSLSTETGDALAAFALELRALRDHMGPDAPSVDSVARRTGIARSTIYAALGGKRLPSRDVITALARAWGGDAAEWIDKRSVAEGRLDSEPAREPADWRSSDRRRSVRQADHEMALAIDLLASCSNRSPQEIEKRDFINAFSADLRSLHRLAGKPGIDELAEKTSIDKNKLIAYFSGKNLPGRQRVVAIVQALSTCAAERNRQLAPHQVDVIGWERKWRVAKNPGMQKIVRNKATAEDLPGEDSA